MVKRFLGRIFWPTFVFVVAASCGLVIGLSVTGNM